MTRAALRCTSSASIDSRSRSSASALSRAPSRSSSSVSSDSEIAAVWSSTVRRRGSDGCAVSTGITSMRSSSSCTADAATPLSLSVRHAAAIEAGGGAVRRIAPAQRADPVLFFGGVQQVKQLGERARQELDLGGIEARRCPRRNRRDPRRADPRAARPPLRARAAPAPAPRCQTIRRRSRREDRPKGPCFARVSRAISAIATTFRARAGQCKPARHKSGECDAIQRV